jgi:hypothetical protein
MEGMIEKGREGYSSSKPTPPPESIGFKFKTKACQTALQKPQHDCHPENNIPSLLRV